MPRRDSRLASHKQSDSGRRAGNAAPLQRPLSRQSNRHCTTGACPANAPRALRKSRAATRCWRPSRRARCHAVRCFHARQVPPRATLRTSRHSLRRPAPHRRRAAKGSQVDSTPSRPAPRVAPRARDEMQSAPAPKQTQNSRDDRSQGIAHARADASGSRPEFHPSRWRSRNSPRQTVLLPNARCRRAIRQVRGTRRVSVPLRKASARTTGATATRPWHTS